jgi:hypothetical protein
MFSNRLTFGALAVACIAAASAGGYFGSRQNAVPAPAIAAEQPSSVSEATVVETQVQETEAVVDDRASQTARAPELEATGRVTPRAARPTAAAAPRSTPTTARPEPPALERSWPTSTASQPQTTSLPGAPGVPGSPASSPAAGDTVTGRPIEDSVELGRATEAPEPPQKVFEEIVVSPSSVIGLQTETRISSETAQLEDRVEAKVTRDVKVGDAIAIPAGSRAIGSVIQVERGGKFKARARLGIRFTTLVLADGTRMPMSTDAIYREGEAPGNSSAKKIGGGAVGGAILGAILGGAKGAAIGATAGAGGGVAVVQAGDANEVTLPAGSQLTVRLLTPLTMTVEQQ